MFYSQNINKRHLLIERQIFIAQSQEHKFIKFNPVLENL